MPPEVRILPHGVVNVFRDLWGVRAKGGRCMRVLRGIREVRVTGDGIERTVRMQAGGCRVFLVLPLLCLRARLASKGSYSLFGKTPSFGGGGKDEK